MNNLSINGGPEDKVHYYEEDQIQNYYEHSEIQVDSKMHTVYKLAKTEVNTILERNWELQLVNNFVFAKDKSIIKEKDEQVS